MTSQRRHDVRRPHAPVDTRHVEEELPGATHLLAGVALCEAEELLRRRLVLEHPAEHLEAALSRVPYNRRSNVTERQVTMETRSTALCSTVCRKASKRNSTGCVRCA